MSYMMTLPWCSNLRWKYPLVFCDDDDDGDDDDDDYDDDHRHHHHEYNSHDISQRVDGYNWYNSIEP